MADKEQYTIINKSSVELAGDYRDLLKEISEYRETINTSAEEEFGLQKDLTMTLKESLMREQYLRNRILVTKNAELEATKAMIKAGADEPAKRKQEIIIKSAQQNRKLYEDEIAYLQKSRIVGWLPLLAVLAHVWTLFGDLEEAAWKFRQTMGMTRDSAAGLRKQVERIAIDAMHLGVTFNGAYKALTELGDEMGSVYAVSSQLVKTTALLKSQLGVSEEASAGFMKNLAAVSQSTMQSQENMAYIAADLSRAAGVPLPQIMKDIAKKSDVTLTMMSRLPNQVLRTAIELRRMGTNLNDAAKSSREILNFSDSINAEMEASVLLGRSINLQRARELAYRRDIEGSTKEILRITKQINFEGLDAFQQEAFARATGRSVSELLSMVQAERQWNAARRSSDPLIQKQVKAYEDLRRANEATVKARAKDLQTMIQTKANQERIVSIQNKWNMLMAKVSEFFLPMIDVALGFVADNLEAIIIAVTAFKYGWRAVFGVVKGIGTSLTFVAAAIGKMGSALKSLKIMNWAVSLSEVAKNMIAIAGTTGTVMQKFVAFTALFGRFGATIFKIGKPFVWLLETIGSKLGMLKTAFGFLGGLGKFAGIFGTLFKAVPVLGWVITAFQLIYNVVKNVKEYMDGWSQMSWGERIVKGLLIIPKAIWNTIVQPFVDAFNWIVKKLGFGANSPSKLGLSIVKGLTSVGTMLFDAITSPWRKALAWIFSKIPGMSKIAKTLEGGLSGMLGDNKSASVEKRAVAAYVPAVTVTPQGTTVVGAPKPATAAGGEKDGDTTTLADVVASNNKVVEAINSLRADMKNGGIAINMDGQLLSATLARQTEFRRGFGVNKI